MGAEPGQGQVAAVDGQQHGGVVEAEAAFRLDELLVKVLAGLGVFFVLVLLADKALDHPDAAKILLHHLVQAVVGLEDPAEDGVHRLHDGKNADAQDGQGDEKHHRERAVDLEGHNHGQDQHARRPHRHANGHHKGILNVGDVGGQAGDDG